MFPKIPVNLLHPEFFEKSYDEYKDGTDYKPLQEKVEEERIIEAQYRVPTERTRGNELFRRMPDGSLNLKAARDIIVDALHIVRDHGEGLLNSAQRAALSVIFPDLFEGLDSGMVASVRAVMCRVSPKETEQLALLVAMHLSEEMNYNAGLGGGSTPGRSQSTS